MSNEITITKGSTSNAPMDLLLLADPSEEMINRYLSDSDLFVAKEGGKTIGVLALKKEGNEAEIMNVAVNEHHQGIGIGSTLIRQAIEFAKSSGIEKLIIGTADTSTDQQRLYEKLGFKTSERINDFFPTHYPEPIIENGVEARDMIRFAMTLKPTL